MGFSIENGYVPLTVPEIMLAFMDGVNTQFGTTYTIETFEGSNFYKYFYYIAQRIQGNEVKTAEIFLKLQTYISGTNERIQRPSVSFPGIIDSFESEGWTASVKPNLLVDAGTIAICVDVDPLGVDYAAEKLEINTLIKDFVVAGMVYLGTETSAITLSNGQEFDFKFYLPTVKVTHLRLTMVTSDNNLLTIPSDVELRTTLLANIAARYRLGWDFEPQKYFGTLDAPWASTILLEYSHNAGGTWATIVYQADFKDLFTFSLANTQILVT
jgi:hypothetical protein